MNKNEKQSEQQEMIAKLEEYYSTVGINTNAVEDKLQFSNVNEEDNLK
jgi:hypothetical protein